MTGALIVNGLNYVLQKWKIGLLRYSMYIALIKSKSLLQNRVNRNRGRSRTEITMMQNEQTKEPLRISE